MVLAADTNYGASATGDVYCTYTDPDYPDVPSCVCDSCSRGTEENVELGQFVGSIFRAFFKFDTSNVSGTITSVKLFIPVWGEVSDTDFSFNVFSGMGCLPDPGIGSPDWGACTTAETGSSFNTANWPGNDNYVVWSINTNSINTTGSTGFRITSSREGTAPTGNEYIMTYYPGNSTHAPQLQVTTGAVPEYSAIAFAFVAIVSLAVGIFFARKQH